MSDYKYIKPKGDMYKISIRKWNKEFANRGRWPFLYVEAYVKDDTIITHYLYTILAKLFITFIYPLLVICEGYKTANRSVYRAWKEREAGSFSSDVTYRRHVNEWQKLEKLIGKKL